MFKQAFGPTLNLLRISKNNARCFATLPSNLSIKKDYYEILNVDKNASLEEIKAAYRDLAKKYHPDVNTTGTAHQPNLERFKDVAEAYAILSTDESRIQYDIATYTNPDSLYASQRMEVNRAYHNRGKDGNPIKERPAADTYAAEKEELLREQRKKFNIDEFGRFKGGVPQKGKGHNRGGALGSAGTAHDPETINMKINPDPTEQRITRRDTEAYKNYMLDDEFGITRRFTYFEATVDYNYFEFPQYRTGLRWIRNFILFFGGSVFVAGLYSRYTNRRLFTQVLNMDNVDLSKGIRIGEKNVILSSTGILEYGPESTKHHH